MNRLPHWCLTDSRPAFYDTESATAIEQTAKLYGAMNELIDENEAFTVNVSETVSTFTNHINNEIDRQDRKIETGMVDIVNNAIAEGRLNIGTTYNANTRALNLIVSGGVV